MFKYRVIDAMENTFSANITNKIKGFAENMGNLAVKGVSNIPVLPVEKNGHNQELVFLLGSLVMNL